MNSFLLIQKDSKSHKNTILKECIKMAIDPVDITIINSVEQPSESDSPTRPKGIALIRQAIKSMYLKPMRGEKKAVVILHADTLSVPAQNALLKTLEEPPPHTFIYLSAENTTLLPTILSRCQTLSYNNPLRDSESVEAVLPKSLTIPQALLLANRLSKEKTEALLFLESQIFSSHTRLIDSIRTGEKGSIGQFSLLLKDLMGTFRLIKSSNVNVRFALESLFLSDTFQK